MVYTPLPYREGLGVGLLWVGLLWVGLLGLFFRATIEQVVCQGDAYAGGTHPGPAVLALLEEGGLLRPLVVVEVVAVGGVHGVLVLVGVVLAAEEAGLEGELESPVAVAAYGQHVACSHAGAGSFAYPSSVGVEAKAEDTPMHIALEVKAAECPPSPLISPISLISPMSPMSPQVVAGLYLVVPHLEVLVLLVVLPPGEVDGGSEGEVPTLGVVLHGDVGDGAPAVVAGHVGQVVEEVGLHGEELAAGCLRAGRGGDGVAGDDYCYGLFSL